MNLLGALLLNLFLAPATLVAAFLVSAPFVLSANSRYSRISRPTAMIVGSLAGLGTWVGFFRWLVAHDLPVFPDAYIWRVALVGTLDGLAAGWAYEKALP